MFKKNLILKTLSGLIFKIINAPGGIRTRIVFFVRKVLFPLSYRGVKFDKNNNKYLINCQ
jgi:hypothetical protein